jgi:miniconductance mechanosensitive channel
VLNAVNDIYMTTSYAHHRSIKGYLQLLKILVFFLSSILIVAVILGKDPTVLIAGLGAMAAVLMLVFKDTILGFVASIQLSANDMVKIGDWIEMPSHRADGTVIDITLNTVKVQNWDKTITTIPTYALVSDSFNNWKGMEESGGRRIKRSIFIDVNSIRFIDVDMLKKFERYELIRDYVVRKQEEITQYNKERNLSDEDLISGRRQTNVGIFRKYLENYLKANPNVRQDMTFLVRQLQPGDKGLPIEIYVFSKETAWAVYEGIQADIFDHVFAVVPEFGLRIFQAPSGNDISQAAGKLLTP